ncbi:hypothetical protein BO83DRAFT_446512 [Aspergillus eucalypticola CBS 122712]|uniref:Uncharacterized protein n=1 Tax=Aspergillus eucalypticola (strain CBS 122712 / IBT 29274) TaxID=1448314 RepID=A0A317VDK4_ASPEC|nr:uncharacterized protein BO83DRAFT_446512 [Aspergillus eucalypticola CBS 122712]PWY72095.1 hypothetical protein BO83DRAFT_446512 [Aspergillus eucalypticola CBS 122712]
MAANSLDLPLANVPSAITCAAACPRFSNVPQVRIMASGKCTFVFTTGQLKFHCPCEKGEFHLGSMVDPNEECKLCDHQLQLHQDAVPFKPSSIYGFQPQGPPHLPTVFKAVASVIIDEDVKDTGLCRIADDVTVSPRQHTVAELIKLIDAYPVVHVRGTPASGKTTLARLLRDSLQDQGRIVPFVHTWKQNLDELDSEPWVALAMALKQRLPPVHIPNLMSNEVVMIVDEAQMSYDDDYLWNFIIKSLIDKPDRYKLRVCLFCCYGSPSMGLEPPQGSKFFTPVTIPETQRITLTPQLCSESPKIGLSYTESEFNDVLCRIVRYEFSNLVVTIDEEAKRYVFSLTNGHPGGVTAMIRFICETYRTDMKHDRTFVISQQHVLNILDGNEDSAFEFLVKCGVARSFPRPIDLKSPVYEIFCEIAEKGHIDWEQRPGLEVCYVRGWIHRVLAGLTANLEEYEIAVLPSRLHEKWIQYLIGRDKRPLPTRFTYLTQLCMEILPEFSRMNLKHSTTSKILSTAAQPRFVEAQYQDEFYRSFCKLAGRGVPISTEWARTNSGRVDFFIPEKKWAVELLRAYDRVDDHIRRFQKGGQ